MKRYISITTGDSDGIGLEVAYKALSLLGPQKNIQFLLWRSPHKSSAQKFLNKKFKVLRSQQADFGTSFNERCLLEVHSDLPPAEWVKTSARWASEGKIAGLCTGPLSKLSKGAEQGHTGILQKFSSQRLHMFFLGKKFSVLLATDHIPLSKVSLSLSSATLQHCIQLGLGARDYLPPDQRNKPIGILGLNPHSGENGIIGKEESDWLSAFIKRQSENFPLQGPLVPDTAFLKENWNRYSLYLALYHDQGLIPFKTIHGFEGVHLTLGLPFVRTSVDHGTAKELYGKGVADPRSMLSALKWAVRLTK